MTVIADTSPVNYLAIIGKTHLLPQLYQSVLIPPAVVNELSRSSAPEQVRAFISNPPEWLIIKTPSLPLDPRLEDLDTGERDALALALQMKADLVLVDEQDARLVAKQCGLVVAGTLRVLATAAKRNLIDLSQTFTFLRATNFRADPKLYDTLLLQDAAERQKKE